MKLSELADYKIRSNDLVQPGMSWDKVIRQNEILRITDLHGQQGVDFLCFNADRLSERYNAPNTMKAAGHIHIKRGSTLYSDFANPLMRVISDTCSAKHDTIAGCCSSWSNKMLYGVPDAPGCRENFIEALARHDMGWTDIVPNINFFCSVPVHDDGTMESSVFVEGPSSAGDYVELEACMNVLAIISNCPQINNPCNSGNPTDIRVEVCVLA